jgi:hypothetical protein
VLARTEQSGALAEVPGWDAKPAVVARLDRATQSSGAVMTNRAAWNTGSPLEPVIGRRAAPTRWRG